MYVVRYLSLKNRIFIITIPSVNYLGKYFGFYAIGKLRPQSPYHFAQPSARVSQILRYSYLIHMTAAATYADKYLERRQEITTLRYVISQKRADLIFISPVLDTDTVRYK